MIARWEPSPPRNKSDGSGDNMPNIVSWTKKFIFLRKINGKWIFCRHVYKGKRFWNSLSLRSDPYIEYEYALDDFELIQKSAVK
jgi:hypothetical protein